MRGNTGVRFWRARGNLTGDVNTTDTESAGSGKLRITRVGSVIKGYYDEGAGWEWDDSGSGYTFSETYTSDVVVEMFQRNTSNGINTNIDNFVVNSADEVICANSSSSESSSSSSSSSSLSSSSSSTSSSSSESCYVSPYSDDFTGTNGDPPNVHLWKTTGVAPPEINNNELRISLNGSGGGAIQSLFEIKGDFDVQIDWDMVTDPGTGGGLGSEYALEVRIDSNNRLKIYYLPTNDEWTSRRFISGVSNDVDFSENIGTGDSRKLRITRVGSNWSSYRWTSGGSWAVMHSNVAIGSGDIPVNGARVYLNNYSGTPNSAVDFDNWSMTADEVVCAPSSSSSSSTSSSSSSSSSSTSSSSSSSTSSSSYSSCAIDLDDPFDGPNGTKPNPNRWDRTDDDDILEYIGNVLWFDARSIDTTSVQAQIETKYTLQGEFHIEHRFTCNTQGSGGATAFNHFPLLQIKRRSDDVVIAEISRSRGMGFLNGFRSEGLDAAQDTVTSSTSGGGLRIVRDATAGITVYGLGVVGLLPM